MQRNLNLHELTRTLSGLDVYPIATVEAYNHQCAANLYRVVTVSMKSNKMILLIPMAAETMYVTHCSH